jgi:hypothetical protein
MAAHQTLNLFILVRIQVPQPENFWMTSETDLDVTAWLSGQQTTSDRPSNGFKARLFV